MSADRYSEGKPQMSYILDFKHAVPELCRVCEVGAVKYARGNWKKGLPYTGMVDSLLRHLAAFQNGQDLDEESGHNHMAHVAWNALALLEYTYTHPEKDDRGIA